MLLNRLCYIRSVPAHENSVKCVAINDATGDIATACYQGIAVISIPFDLSAILSDDMRHAYKKPWCLL